MYLCQRAGLEPKIVSKTASLRVKWCFLLLNDTNFEEWCIVAAGVALYYAVKLYQLIVGSTWKFQNYLVLELFYIPGLILRENTDKPADPNCVPHLDDFRQTGTLSRKVSTEAEARMSFMLTEVYEYTSKHFFLQKASIKAILWYNVQKSTVQELRGRKFQWDIPDTTEHSWINRSRLFMTY